MSEFFLGGRALRRVPGPPAGQFPELNHPNWGVVVTHSALGLRELFEKFQQGVPSDVIKDAPPALPVRPVLSAAYSAGAPVLKLSSTSTVKPGDVLELRVPVVALEEQSPKFSLVDELLRTGSLSAVSADDSASGSSNGSVKSDASAAPHSSSPKPASFQLTILPWQQEADAVAQRLAEIQSVRTYQIQVEAVLDAHNVQITPAWSDIPQGVEISKRRTNLEVPEANFLHHVGLDWQVLVEGELISYSDYRRRVVLQKHGMSLDSEGEIVVGGVRLKDTMPPAALSLFLKGLEAELATKEVEVPQSNALSPS